MTNIQNYQQICSDTREARIERILKQPGLNDAHKQVLQRFDYFNIEKGKSLATRMAYLQSVKTLIVGNPQNKAGTVNKPFASITGEDVKTFIREFYKNKSPVTIYVAQVNIMQFFRWLYSDKKQRDSGKLELKDNIEPISWMQLKRKDKEKLIEEILSTDDINKMASVCENFRDKAIIKLLYETGARKGEFLQLRIKHLTEDQHGMVCMLPKGKTVGRRLRIINSCPDVKMWLNNHPHKDNPDAPLFVTQGSHLGRGIYEDGLKMILKKYATRAKINKQIYPHLFRHSRATELAKQEFREAELRVFFGWSKNSDMPSRYIHLAGGDIEEKLLAMDGNDEAIKQAKAKAEKLRAWKCPRCQENNGSQEKYCNKCGWDRDLDYKTWQFKEDEIKAMTEQMANLCIRLAKLENTPIEDFKQEKERRGLA